MAEASRDTADEGRCVEPSTFAERAVFLRQMNREYLEGRIDWNTLWYYEQRYGFGCHGTRDTPRTKTAR